MAIKPEFQELKQRSLYSKLKKLFSTGTVVRNIGGKKLKVVDTDGIQYATDKNTIRDRFNKIRTTAYNQYSRDFSQAYHANRMELFRTFDCISGDTVIPTPDGKNKTIRELCDIYTNPTQTFPVFSYDLETNTVRVGNAYHPRSKGIQKTWKITLDKGEFLIATDNHPFLMRNGEYKLVKDLKENDRVMPFYQKDFYNSGYRSIYNFKKGWQVEHRLIAEDTQRPLLTNEVVHHRNFDKTNNNPENLSIMDSEDHKRYHVDFINKKLWSPENREKQLDAIRRAVKNRKTYSWNGKRIGVGNPFYGMIHTEESNSKRSISLKKFKQNIDSSKEKNYNFRDDITLDTIKEKSIELYKETGKLNIFELCKYIECDYRLIKNRLVWNDLDWNTFKLGICNSLNHTIKSIEYYGEIEVFDLSVEKYQNFATDICFIHNCMDQDAILSSAIDVYADECTSLSELGNILTIHSSDDNIKDILNNLFYDILNIEFNLWSWTRNLVKYGDFFLKLYVSPEYGVYQIEPMSSYYVTRIENSDPSNKEYVKFSCNLPAGGKIEELENYEVAHFRLLSDSNMLPYGRSMLEGARRSWQQLSLLEDAMLIHRVMRAPEKRIFKVDVGNIPPAEVDQYMDRLINKIKKVPFMDENTGDYNLKFNLQNMVEDYYLPVRGNDSGTSIEPLAGMEFTGIDDVEYIRNKMMAALKIPKAYLGYDADAGGKSLLSSEDVRFAKTIGRIQNIIVSELKKIAMVHLSAQGYKDASLVDFELKLTNPSTIFEKEKIAIWSDKVNVAKDMMENKLFSKAWIYKNVFNMSPDDMDDIKNEVVEDSKQSFRFKKIEEEGIDPAKPFKQIKVPGAIETTNPGNDDFSGEGGLGGDSGENDGGGGPSGNPAPPAGGGADSSPPPVSPSDKPIQENINNLEWIKKVAESLDSGVPIDESNLEWDIIPEGEASDDYVRPSQAGIKKASDYPFGEDPLGSLSRKSRNTERDNSRKHKFKNNSPLSLEGLNAYLKKEKIKLLGENSNSKSYLDESNILKS